jgi:hypothetical protein
VVRNELVREPDRLRALEGSVVVGRVGGFIIGRLVADDMGRYIISELARE